MCIKVPAEKLCCSRFLFRVCTVIAHDVLLLSQMQVVQQHRDQAIITNRVMYLTISTTLWLSEKIIASISFLIPPLSLGGESSQYPERAFV